MSNKINSDIILQKMLLLSYYKSKDCLYTTIPYKGRKRSVPVYGSEYISYITSQVYNETGEFIQEIDIKNRLKIITFSLIDEDCCEELYPKRYVCNEGKIYINIANEKMQHIEVSSEGYRIIDCVDDTPLFVKNSMELPMVIPKEEDDTSPLLSDLDSIINLSEEDIFLLKVWLITSMNPNINIPILYFLGNPGTGKSSIQKLISDLIDPSKRGLVNWEDNSNNDIAIALDHSHLVNFDNVSKITGSRSDILCQSVTGGNNSTRRKYTDEEEITFDLKTRVTISSVRDCIVRDDLTSRTFYMNVPKIANKARIREDDYLSKYASKKAKIWGQMLDVLSIALSLYPEWKEEHQSCHRLASFDVFGSLVASILDEEHGYDKFRSIIQEKRVQQIFHKDDGNVFMSCMFATLKEDFENEYSGTTRKLYDNTVEWITESPNSNYNTEAIVSYDKFAKMLRSYEDDFGLLGYEISFYRIKKDNVSAVSIKKEENNSMI